MFGRAVSAREPDPTDVPSVASSVRVDDPADETGSLARDLAAGFVGLVRSYRDVMGLTPEQAVESARETGEWAERDALEKPPDEINWWTLSTLVEEKPEVVRAAWERIGEEARAELASGHRAARALEHDSRPWERARFLALRRAFREEWRPRGGIEDALIDAMAQAYTGYLAWLERLDIQATGEGKVEDHQIKERGYYLTPRVTTAQAMEQSAAMARRFHRLFLESLRALRDGRRSQSLHVGRAAQVNVGAAQLNVALPVEREERVLE